MRFVDAFAGETGQIQRQTGQEFRRRHCENWSAGCKNLDGNRVVRRIAVNVSGMDVAGMLQANLAISIL